MPEFILDLGDTMSARAFRDLDAFTQGYIEAMFFTETGTGDDGELEDATFADLAPETVEQIVSECTAFQEAASALLELAYERTGYDAERAGRDFWFTRNGHGAGYWDRTELDADNLGDQLSAVCGWKTEFSERDLYRGDDGKVYLS